MCTDCAVGCPCCACCRHLESHARLRRPRNVGGRRRERAHGRGFRVSRSRGRVHPRSAGYRGLRDGAVSRGSPVLSLERLPRRTCRALRRGWSVALPGSATLFQNGRLSGDEPPHGGGGRRWHVPGDAACRRHSTRGRRPLPTGGAHLHVRIRAGGMRWPNCRVHPRHLGRLPHRSGRGLLRQRRRRRRLNGRTTAGREARARVFAASDRHVNTVIARPLWHASPARGAPLHDRGLDATDPLPQAPAGPAYLQSVRPEYGLAVARWKPLQGAPSGPGKVRVVLQ